MLAPKIFSKNIGGVARELQYADIGNVSYPCEPKDEDLSFSRFACLTIHRPAGFGVKISPAVKCMDPL